ncbi:THO complex subunit 2 isoform X2 [Cryptomeria japonica]|uniref:THO complex subunit 2 isoform X2 n=1 Tax=Cryptomeria japonica TaxID=3369 RepID=UPI0027DA781F|nr:THO complex subunit 2 isoform X2 [Cryptomeria japonica]
MAVLPVECKYVTDDCIREWKSGGSGSIVKLPVVVPPERFIYELCWTMVRGELPLSKCKIAIESVEFSEKQIKEETASILADTIAHMGQELTLPDEFRVRLVELSKWLVESNLVPVRLLQERCEAEFLWESEMIKINAADLKSKEVRVNTRLLYQQTKFNLLREESEGYAKLVTLLCQRGSSALTHKTAPAAISTIKSLIGHFDLDPNRVFDIVLECFELQPENDGFFELIPIFPKSHASHILGFKFQYYQRLEVNERVPDGLYRLTAALVKADFIELDNIYLHLLPKDEEAFEHYEEFSKKRLDEANKIGKINLAATGKDLMEEEKPGDVTIDLFAALDIESEAAAERSTELVTNQKLGLLKGFLDVDDWPHAHVLLDRLSPLNPVAHYQICHGLFMAIEKTISSTYALLRQSHSAKPSSSRFIDGAANAEGIFKSTGQSSLIELPRELFQMLSDVGPYLHQDALLLQKVCRVLRGYYTSTLALVASAGSSNIQELGDGDRKDPRLRLKEARLNIEEALGTCLLPSLQLIPANPAVGQEIWEVMSLLPYEARYRLYGEWEKDDERVPLVLVARLTAKLDTRRILKRLAKDNLKQLGRMVAKIAHANPMTVLRTIVHQIEAYKDMIAPVVDAFKYLTQLEYDVLEYVVIERLAQGGREKLKEDGLNLSDWLQSLASFWGHLCKKYPSMELRGLFQYVVNQLKRGEGTELVLLQELIYQMANVQHIENMNEEQLDAMAGGEALRYQATSFGLVRNNKAFIKSTSRLRDSLVPKDEPKLAVPLLLLIAQHRSIVVIKADAPYIKMVSEQFDRCHGTLLQYVEFLTSAVTPIVAYAQLIPTLDDLTHKYHLDPEVAFLIYRPIMRLFRPSKGSETCWPADLPHGKKESEQLNTSHELILDLGSHRKPIMWSDLLTTVHSMLPSKAWNSLSPELYVTFWGLTLYDLYVPKRRYETEIAKQHAALKQLEELSDNSHTAIAKRKKEKERIQEVLDRLTSEHQRQEQNVASVHQRLVQEKNSWLTSCPDSLKINMEFLQRCIFPRCVLSMPDAVYCAKFVHTLHSLGTPFFNTVNHIDVLICKALPPMICCCTENEAGRLGRFLHETLKMAYYWKVHWKWSGRITRLLIQCLESNEYMDIRNALIILTKISSVFPVTRKSGINLERRVGKIKADEREDLKVLATSVAAALASRKSSWVSEDEFNMGYIDLKPSASPAKHLAATSLAVSNSSVSVSQHDPSGTRIMPGTVLPGDATGSLPEQMSRSLKTSSALNTDTRLERSESITPPMKSDIHQAAVKPVAGTTDSQNSVQSGGAQVGTSKSSIAGMSKSLDEPSKGSGTHPATVTKTEEISVKLVSKTTATEAEPRPPPKRGGQSASLTKQLKPDTIKEDARSGKAVGRVVPSTGDRDPALRTTETRQNLPINTVIVPSNGGTGSSSGTGKVSGTSAKVPQEMSNISKTETQTSKSVDMRIGGEYEVDRTEPQEASGLQSNRPSKSPHREEALHAPKITDDIMKEKQQKRPNTTDETDRMNKRRKGDSEEKTAEPSEVRGLDHRSVDKARTTDQDKSGYEERNFDKGADKSLDRTKDRAGERVDRDHRGERPERSDKSRSEEHPGDRTRDRSIERFGRERSVDRAQDRATERNFERPLDRNKDERNKDDRNRSRYSESTAEKPHPDDRFPMQNLPPPPPLPPNVVPQSLPVGRREDEVDRRGTSSRPIQRLSPRREEKTEKRRLEEGSVAIMDDSKRRREDEIRKREERDTLPIKVEKERDREKTNLLKEEADASAASKRRRLKRDHLPASETTTNYGPSPPPPPPVPVTALQPYDGRERERKETAAPRGLYIEESGYDKGSTGRIHNKEGGKVARRDHEQVYNRDWEDEKRQRGDAKRARHHRK